MDDELVNLAATLGRLEAAAAYLRRAGAPEQVVNAAVVGGLVGCLREYLTDAAVWAALIEAMDALAASPEADGNPEWDALIGAAAGLKITLRQAAEITALAGRAEMDEGTLQRWLRRYFEVEHVGDLSMEAGRRVMDRLRERAAAGVEVPA